jgi:hypothetical protein
VCNSLRPSCIPQLCDSAPLKGRKAVLGVRIQPAPPDSLDCREILLDSPSKTREFAAILRCTRPKRDWRKPFIKGRGAALQPFSLDGTNGVRFQRVLWANTGDHKSMIQRTPLDSIRFSFPVIAPETGSNCSDRQLHCEDGAEPGLALGNAVVSPGCF